MHTYFFKVDAGQIPIANIRLNTRMGAKDEYRLDIETLPPEPEHDVIPAVHLKDAEIARLRAVIESAYDAPSHEMAMGILHNAMEGR